MVTIVPKLGLRPRPRKNPPDGHGLAESLLGRTRATVLALFFTRPDERFYLRQISRLTGVGSGALQREIRRLVSIGVLLRAQRGAQITYRANPACPVFPELVGLIVKTIGAADVLREAIASLVHSLGKDESRTASGKPGIVSAFVFGSFARGEQQEESDVDLLVVGNVTIMDLARAFRGAQQRLNRAVNPKVYPPAEFRRKLAAGHHFLTRVMREPKIFLIGSEDELTAVAEGRLAATAPGVA